MSWLQVYTKEEAALNWQHVTNSAEAESMGNLKRQPCEVGFETLALGLGPHWQVCDDNVVLSMRDECKRLNQRGLLGQKMTETLSRPNSPDQAIANSEIGLTDRPVEMSPRRKVIFRPQSAMCLELF